jgi:hypothetical protein
VRPSHIASCLAALAAGVVLSGCGRPQESKAQAAAGAPLQWSFRKSRHRTYPPCTSTWVKPPARARARSVRACRGSCSSAPFELQC